MATRELDNLVRCNVDARALEVEVEEEEAKVAVVVEADAVVDPRAVVVHLQYAAFTNAAMVSVSGSESVALLTPPLPT